MHQLAFLPHLLSNLQSQTAIITGSARGIGDATVSVFNAHGANVVIVNLSILRESAETLIKTLKHLERALFIPASITTWQELINVFKTAIDRFGKVDTIVANTGTMESVPILDVAVDSMGEHRIRRG